jgi:hypothetical protein
MLRPESWPRLAGGSPVRVDTAVPGRYRSRFVVEAWRAERDVKSHFGGSKRAGRSVKRTLAASSQSQRRNRAPHVRAKAMSFVPCRGVSPRGSPGVWRAARVSQFSGKSWEKYGTVRFSPHRWPSETARKRLRDKVRGRTDRRRTGRGIRDVIADLKPVLRGWGNYFRTGNAAQKFRTVGKYAVWRLCRLIVKKRGRNLRAGQAGWTQEWFIGRGLYQLSGTIHYPKAA